LHLQYANSGEAFVLFASNSDSSLPFLIGIAERADADMDVAFAERRLPIFRIVRFTIAELVGARSHSYAKRFGKALKRFRREFECLQTGMADSDGQPGVRCLPPARCGIDVRCQTTNKIATRFRIIDAQEQVSTEIRR